MSKERKENVRPVDNSILFETFKQLTGMSEDGIQEASPSGFSEKISLLGAVIFGSSTTQNECRDLDVIFVSKSNTTHYHQEYSAVLRTDFDLEITRRLGVLSFGRLDNGLGFLEPSYVDNPLSELQHKIIRENDSLIIYAFSGSGAKQIRKMIEVIKNN